MSEKNIEEKEDSGAEESLHDVMSGTDALRTPLFWGALLFIPIALTLFVSVRDAPQESRAVEVVAEAEVGEAAEIVRKDVRRPGSRTRAVVDGGGFKGAAGNAYACDFNKLVGLSMSERIEEKVKELGRPYRILPPDSAMTMDYAPARVNFDVDAAGIISRVWCG